jgi:hypothetical protein
MSDCSRLDWLGLALLGVLLTPSGGSAATVRGGVANEAGEPIHRVTVTLEAIGPAGGGDVRSATTDEQGEFRLENVDPGSYRLVAEKSRWVRTEKRVFVLEDKADAELDVHVVMQLTLLSRALAQLQLGLLVYAVLFGLGVLAFNLWIVPEPSREVTVIGWIFVVVSLIVACLKQMWAQAFLLTLLGGIGGLLIHKLGGKVAARRVHDIEEERDKQAAEQQERLDHLAALVGKEGITMTDLKACGTASVEGDVIEVRAEDGFIAKQTRVVITRLEGKTPVVEAWE